MEAKGPACFPAVTGVAKVHFPGEQNQEAIPSDQRSHRGSQWQPRHSQFQEIGMVVVVVIDFLQYVASRTLYSDVELGPGSCRPMELYIANTRYTLAQVSDRFSSVVDNNQLGVLVSLSCEAA